MADFAWMTEAYRHIGKREVVGVKSNPWIVALWIKDKWLGTDDGKVAWGGTFVNFCFASSGYKTPFTPDLASSRNSWIS